MKKRKERKKKGRRNSSFTDCPQLSLSLLCHFDLLLLQHAFPSFELSLIPRYALQSSEMKYEGNYTDANVPLRDKSNSRKLHRLDVKFKRRRESLPERAPSFHALFLDTLCIKRRDLSMCAYDICLTFSSCFAHVGCAQSASSAVRAFISSLCSLFLFFSLLKLFNGPKIKTGRVSFVFPKIRSRS